MFNKTLSLENKFLDEFEKAEKVQLETENKK